MIDHFDHIQPQVIDVINPITLITFTPQVIDVIADHFDHRSPPPKGGKVIGDRCTPLRECTRAITRADGCGVRASPHEPPTGPVASDTHRLRPVVITRSCTGPRI
jgi:hypothetical protein